jgi:hypothetical protein
MPNAPDLGRRIDPTAAGLRFHHLGLAARQPEKAKRFLALLGYTLDPPVYDPLQKTHLIMCHGDNEMPPIEIIYPGDEPSPVDRLLTMYGNSIYHICFETHSLDSSLNVLRERGLRVTTVSPPKPAVLFDGRFVSFYIVPGFGLIEILDHRCTKEETSEKQ